MTGPVTTEALVEKLARVPDERADQARAIMAKFADLPPVQRELVLKMADIIWPLIEQREAADAALQQVTAERDEARAEADNLREALARLIAEQVRQDPAALARAATAREGASHGE
ncbi:hypothetical protein C0214_19415 [Methylobacterium sp. DM1]|nr:hypothetical protein C0214_19415 [Methylobacterium sp. DM1]